MKEVKERIKPLKPLPDISLPIPQKERKKIIRPIQEVSE